MANNTVDDATLSKKGQLPTKDNKEKQVASQIVQLPQWVLVWFYTTAIVCTIDASFIVFRPHTLPGGPLFWLFYPYKWYITVDQRYMDTSDAYVFAQSLLNYAEVVVNIVTIIMHYRLSRYTVPTAFTVTVMTMWKTVLYFMMFSEFCTGGQYRMGNSALQEFFLVVIPNGVWIVVPLAAMAVLWGRLLPPVSETLSGQEIVDAGKYAQLSALSDDDDSGHGRCQWSSKREVVRGPGSGMVSGVWKPKSFNEKVFSEVKQRSGRVGSDRK